MLSVYLSTLIKISYSFVFMLFSPGADMFTCYQRCKRAEISVWRFETLQRYRFRLVPNHQVNVYHFFLATLELDHLLGILNLLLKVYKRAIAHRQTWDSSTDEKRGKQGWVTFLTRKGPEIEPMRIIMRIYPFWKLLVFNKKGLQFSTILLGTSFELLLKLVMPSAKCL